MDELNQFMHQQFRLLTDEREKMVIPYLESKGWVKTGETPFTNFWKDPVDGQSKKTDYAMSLQKAREGETND
jgi:hypothetical protein